MRIKNPERRIKELTRELKRVSDRIYQSNKYNVKTFKKKDIRKLDREGIIQTLNGQSHFLKMQKKSLIKERWKLRQAYKELRNLYEHIKEVKAD